MKPFKLDGEKSSAIPVEQFQTVYFDADGNEIRIFAFPEKFQCIKCLRAISVMRRTSHDEGKFLYIEQCVCGYPEVKEDVPSVPQEPSK